MLLKNELKREVELRGKFLERNIDKVCDRINHIGGFAHKLQPKRTQAGAYLEGEPFDYIVVMKDYKAVFDAKEVKGTKWHMVDKDIKQCNEMKKCKNAGFEAYFIFYFTGKVRVIDIDEIIEVLKSGKKTINLEIGKEWELLRRLREEK